MKRSHLPFWNRSAAALTVVGLGMHGLSGCASRPLPIRPSVNQLIEDSLINSTANLVIESPEDFTEQFSEEITEEFVPFRAQANPNPIGSGLINSQSDDPLINEEFIEQDVRSALAMIAEEAGVDLILDDKVAGVVNTVIVDLPVEQAIEKVLMPLGFVHARHGNQFVICPPTPTSPLFPYIARRSEYRPLNLSADSIIATVPERLKPYVQVITGANLIIVEAPARLSDEILQRFAVVDQPVPQVVLEAIVCVTSPDSGFQFGLDWNHAVDLNGSNALKIGSAGLAMSSVYSSPGGNAVFSDFAKTSGFLKLLSENGYLTIRATPHVMAQDGEQANIAINRQTFFSVQPQSNNSDSNAFIFQQNIQSVESGITLDITPRVRGDVVTLEIEKLEVSEDIRSANTELALNPFPIINRRTVSTTMHVKDGKTIVIGGLVQRETVDRVNRVPGLSRLPLMGYLFENTQRQTRDAEVAIFISPKIVRPTPSTSPNLPHP